MALAAAAEAGRGQMYGLVALSSRHPHIPGQAGASLEARSCLQADVRGFRPEGGSLRERNSPSHQTRHCTSAEQSAGTAGPQEGRVSDTSLS